MTSGSVLTTLPSTSHKRVAVEADIVTHSYASIIDAGQSSVYAEGRLVAVQGALVATHYYAGQLHAGATVIGNLSNSVYAEGKPIALYDSTTSCGASVAAVINSSVFAS